MKSSSCLITKTEYNRGLVRDIALQDPRLREALEELGIDTCCGGGRKIKSALKESGITLEELEAQLEAALNSTDAPPMIDWNKKTDRELIDFLVNVHHASLHRQLPEFDRWFVRALKVHADHIGELLPVYKLFTALRTELEPHLLKEEMMVFPAILNRRPPEEMKSVLKELEAEHAGAGDTLRKLNALTDGYKTPEFACQTVEMLYDGLMRLESALHDHIYLENNILFPRAVAKK